jgi:hypothetical protein
VARKTDDYSLDDEQRRLIRLHAERALQKADAVGRIPTPVADVLAAAQVVVSDEPALEVGFLAKLRKKAGKALRSALSKVWGVLDVAARIIYLDKTVLFVRQTFLKLHETAHAVLPWQRKMFVVAEDCEMTLAPDVAELFEREANALASEVLFQLDAFSQEANDHAFNILVPVRLSSRYKASIYASVRRYVTGSPRACMVLVLEPPKVCPQRGYVAKLRRDVLSPEFRRVVGPLVWPDSFGPDDQIGALIPIGGRKMSRPREIVLQDLNGRRHRCLAEAFTQTHHVFVLIHSVTTLNRRVALA